MYEYIYKVFCNRGKALLKTEKFYEWLKLSIFSVSIHLTYIFYLRMRISLELLSIFDSKLKEFSFSVKGISHLHLALFTHSRGIRNGKIAVSYK